MSGYILIEFFDHESLENVVSLSEGSYRQVFYLYFTDINEPIRQEQATLTTFIQTHLGAEVHFVHAPEATLKGICQLFHRLTGETGRCCIDLTGGSELFVAAAGYYTAREGERVTLQQYDAASGARIFHYPEAPGGAKRLKLTVPEAVALHRAALIGRTEPVDEAFFRRDDLEKEVLRLWDAVKDIPHEWNAFCTMRGLQPAEHRAKQEKRISTPHEEGIYETVMARLREKGLTGPEERRRVGKWDYRIFSLNVPKRAETLYHKGGTLLELYCALAAVRSGVFHDCRTGVMLDCDGRDGPPAGNVKNEVDVILTHGHRPVFVSCKNTRVTNEYLYEIATMARHYGGGYACAAVVSNDACNDAVRARAREMGVILIDRLSKLSFEKFTALLRRYFPPQK